MIRRAHGSSDCRTRRTAHEDLPAAGGIPHAGGIERPRDRQRFHVRMARRIDRVERAAHERLQPHGAGRGGGQERRRDSVDAGLQRHTDIEALLDLVTRGRGVLHRRLEVRRPAECRQQDTAAIDGDLELMRILEPAHRRGVGAVQLHLQPVLRVERNGRLNGQPAKRPERQAVDVNVLGRVLPHAEDLTGWLDPAIADGQRRNPSRGREIPLEQHRRHAQGVGNVVEAVRRVVRRQERCGVHVERDEIANRVGVLGAVQAMNEGSAGAGPRRRGIVQDPLERGRERVAFGLPGPRHACRRHHARPDLANDLLPHLGVRRDVGKVHLVERQACGLQARVVAADAVSGQKSLGVCSRPGRGYGRGRGLRDRTDLGRDEHDDRRERSPAHSGEIISPIQHRRHPSQTSGQGAGRPAQGAE